MTCTSLEQPCFHDQLIWQLFSHLSLKYQKILKKAIRYNFLGLIRMSSNVLLYLINSPECKDIHFTIMHMRYISNPQSQEAETSEHFSITA